MTSTIAEKPGVTPEGTVAVRDLVRRRLGVEPDTWDLALVQRAETWDQVRMRHLLDSLLAGYPIGAILLCRVREASKIMRVDASGGRHVEEAVADAWQLLDGQQRINALTSVFTDKGRYGRFYLNMTVARTPPGPTSLRSTKDRALAYIAWRDRPAEPEDTDVDAQPDVDVVAAPIDSIPDRDQYLDLSRWFEWAEVRTGDRVARALDELEPRQVARLLRDIDPEFSAELIEVAADIASDRLRRLMVAWTRPSIPVLQAEVESPFDVLEVFTRINLGGVQIGGTDVYLAAVKTFWSEAETRLELVRDATGGMLDRIECLQLISRLAARGIGQGDVLPLAVDRLAGDRGGVLLAAMQELTADGSRFLTRLDRFCDQLQTKSKLGYGLKLVSRRVWDEVLAWAIASERDDEEWFTSNLEEIDAYLLGATLFRYSRVLGARFQRLALLEALAAGVRGESFPLRRIIEVARGGNVDLRGSRDRVRSLSNDDDRLWTADWNTGLLLSIAQVLPYATRGIDWDHIFPAAQSQRMWAVSQYGRKMHHPLRRFVNSAGNLWALHLTTNRGLGDKPPTVKFPILDEALKTGEGYPIWPRGQWSLEAAEIERFEDVDRGLTDDVASIDRAMAEFRDLVVGRANRILDGALSNFPGAQLFDPIAEVGGADPSSVSRDALAVALGVTVPKIKQHLIDSISGGPHRVPDSVDVGPAWVGREDQLFRVWNEATRRATKMFNPERRSVLPRQNRLYDFDYMRWIWLGVSLGGIHISVGAAPAIRSHSEIDTPLWCRISNDVHAYRAIRTALDTSELAPRTTESVDAIWIGLLVDPDVGESSQVDDMVRQLETVRDLISRQW